MTARGGRLYAAVRLGKAAGLRGLRPALQGREAQMTSADVIDLYAALQNHGVKIWVDGGWGVDALLGEQTRSHGDLDIAIEQKDVAKLREFLEDRGYREIKVEIARPWNFVLGDASGREMDVHVIVLTEKGDGLYGPAEKGEMYPAAALTGTGTIGVQTVRCISPEWAIQFHSGYELKEKDFRDVSALCAKFGIGLPAIYERFRK
jgi:lincosamide nucleotidyltransferase A/C/D/E